MSMVRMVLKGELPRNGCSEREEKVVGGGRDMVHKSIILKKDPPRERVQRVLHLHLRHITRGELLSQRENYYQGGMK